MKTREQRKKSENFYLQNNEYFFICFARCNFEALLELWQRRSVQNELRIELITHNKTNYKLYFSCLMLGRFFFI